MERYGVQVWDRSSELAGRGGPSGRQAGRILPTNCPIHVASGAYSGSGHLLHGSEIIIEIIMQSQFAWTIMLQFIACMNLPFYVEMGFFFSISKV